VYTVALGTPTGVITRGGFSRPVPPDPTTLRQIAQTTGGEFFEIHDQKRLNAVYEDLATRFGHKKEWRELSFILVGLAALFALAAGAASLVWGQRLPRGGSRSSSASRCRSGWAPPVRLRPRRASRTSSRRWCRPS
jgi:Ca-activated chloride channel homolog